MFRKTTLAIALAVFTVGTANAETFVRIGGGLAGTYPVFAAKLAELINENIPDVKANVVSGNVEKSQIGVQTGELDLTGRRLHFAQRPARWNHTELRFRRSAPEPSDMQNPFPDLSGSIR